MIYPLEFNSKQEIDWSKSAKSHDNYRLSRSLIATTQILAATLLHHGLKTEIKPISSNHPFHLWTVESTDNINSIFTFGDALSNEFYIRFGKIHKSGILLQKMRSDLEKIKIKDEKKNNFPLAMPEEFKADDVIQSYRNFWVSKEKMRYPHDKVPIWFVNMRTKPYEITR